MDDAFERVYQTIYMPNVSKAVTPFTHNLSEKFRSRSAQPLESLGSVLLFYQNGQPMGRLSVQQQSGQIINEHSVMAFVSKYTGDVYTTPQQQNIMKMSAGGMMPNANYGTNLKPNIIRQGKGTEPAIYTNETENYFLQRQYGTQPPVHAPPAWSLRVQQPRL